MRSRAYDGEVFHQRATGNVIKNKVKGYTPLFNSEL